MLEETKGSQETSQSTSVEVEEIQGENTEISAQSVENEEINSIETPTKEIIENKGLFIVKSSNEWIEEAKNQPLPKMLFDKFWFENELCILFADTNVGKSLLAVQIGDSISRGQAINDFEMDTGKQKVLYFDFELSNKQFQIRYCDDSEGQNNYVFDDNFIRVEFNPDMELPKGKKIEDCLIEELEKVVTETGSKTVIIDNITYLREGTEKANDALPLMKQLKLLKQRHDLSILTLAHTPKRNLSNPLTRNDLQGSKMLMNLCDSSFAIGESHTDIRLRYLKQIKQRNCEQVYNADNIIICEVDKLDNFLQFKFIDYGREFEHLKPRSEDDKVKKQQEAAELKVQGFSNCEIARRIGVSEKTIRNWLK